jgi:hypothetical protein
MSAANLCMLALVLLLTACGGGDDDSDTGNPRVHTPTVDCSTGECK